MSLLFIYLSINLKKNKILFLWPINIFKVFANIFNSILLIPFFEICISILNCKKLNMYFPEVSCYQNEYIAHTIFAIIGILVTFFFSMIFSLFYFDLKTISNNRKNRQNDIIELSLTLLKILFVLVFEIFSQFLDSQNFILSLILLFGTAFIYYHLKIHQPFLFFSTYKVYT